MIGRGGFGKVWKIFDKKFKKYYALKEISKVKVIDKNSINAIKYERELLSNLNHTLIINMHYAFQDYDNLYLVLDLLTGGDLRYQISRHPRQYFSEIQTKFFISCLIEALFYIHSKKIIHRDIKPENLIFDENGYLHITDFGIAKFYNKNNSHETSGTPGYMAPEVMQGCNHNYSVDFYAIGVITYELMMGKRPYSGKTRKEIKEQIMGKQAKISKLEIPEGWSFEAVDFTNKLLARKEINRLGYYNENEIKEHPWLNDVNMDLIKNKKIKATFIPKKNHDNYDKNYCQEDEEINLDTLNRFEEYKLNQNYRDLFNGFTFYNININTNINLNDNNINNNDIKNKTLIIYNKKNLNDNNNIIIYNNNKNNNNNYSSEKMNKSLKVIHQRYKSNNNVSNINNINNIDKNINTNYSLSKIMTKKNNDIKLLENAFSPINNNYIQGYDKKQNKNNIKDNKDNKGRKSKRSKSFSLNLLKNEQIDNNNSYMKLLRDLNYKNINNENNNNKNNNNLLDTDNSIINNNMMKLSTNFYLPNSIKNEKRERPKSIANLNIGVIIDKKNISKNKNNKIKQLNTKKHFYQNKKLNKNYSQGNIQSKNSIKINNINNNHKSIINDNNSHLYHHKSLSKSKLSKINPINKINKSKTIVRNNSIKRNKLNLPQKKIPIPKTSGKKFTRKKLDTKIILNINDSNKYNYTNGPGILHIKNFANTTKGKVTHYNKKDISNNLCKNLLNELSFNNNDNYINQLNIQANYNTINVEERSNNNRECNKSLNTDLLFSLKKVNSFKNINSKHKTKGMNNSTKLIKNKVKININENINKKNINYLNNTNYKFKVQKKINTIFNESDNKSQINSKILSFESNNNFNSNSIVNNNRSINNKNRIRRKNILTKGKNIIGNYSYQSAYSTASTGQTKINNK